MANSGYRFTIKVDGARRVFLSLSERASGDVTLILRHADHYEHNTSNPNTVMKVQRYSLHFSPGSTEFCTIKHTIELRNGQQITSSHVTSAIKENAGRFAILFLRLTPALRRDKYKLGIQDKSAVFNLGEYDPASFIFCHAVIVGSPDHEFPTQSNHFNVFQRTFGKFRFILLWSFLTLPSSDAGRLVHNLTIPPELAPDLNIRRDLRNLMTGQEAQDCIKAYLEKRAILTQNWISVVASQYAPQMKEQMVAMAGYVKEPSFRSPEMIAHAQRISLRLDALTTSRR
jgi:hypothetical protein